MARPGYSTMGAASVAAVFLALCSSRGVQAFVTPLAPSRGGCSAAQIWHGHGHGLDGVVVGSGSRGVRARTPRELEVVTGGSTAESSSVAEEDDSIRTGQIKAFSNKVCECVCVCVRVYFLHERCPIF